MSDKLLLVDDYIKRVLIDIYSNVFLKLNQEQVDIFLCGGASKKGAISDRDAVRKLLDKDKHVRILYPEDLFIEILNKDKNADLLTLEGVLADNCDIICIICESPGALVELGAFTNNNKTVNKVIVALEEQRKRDKSFIMLGPVKVLKRNDSKSIIFYSKKDVSDLHKKLNSVFNQRRTYKAKGKSGTDKRDINSIIGMHYYALLILYFFNSLEYIELINYIKYAFENKGYDVKNFDTIFNPSVRYLYKRKYIQRLTKGDKTYIVLTTNGYNFIENIMENLKINSKSRLYDSIRFAIMKRRYYKQRHSS